MSTMKLKTKDDIDKIIDMFLFQEKDPLLDDEKIEDEEQPDAGVESDQEELYRKRCGQQLAKMGDQFYKENAKGQVANQAEQMQQNLVQKIKETLNIENEDKAWKRFKEVIDSSTKGNIIVDSFKTLGTLLLAVHGLRTLGEGTKKLAASFASRYVSEAKLDIDIERIGGLSRFLADNLDELE